jgi:hypothetical protein
MSGRVKGAKPNIAIKTTDLKYEDYRARDGRKKKKVKKSSDVDVTAQKDSFGVKVGIRVERGQEVELSLYAGPNGKVVVPIDDEEPDDNGVMQIAREMAKAFGGDESDWRGFNVTYLKDYGSHFSTKFRLQPIDNIPANGFQILPVILARVETDLTKGHYFVGASIVPGADSRGRAIRLGGRRTRKSAKAR